MENAFKQIILESLSALRDEEVRTAIKNAEGDLDALIGKLGGICASMLAALRENKIMMLKGYMELGLSPQESANLLMEQSRAQVECFRASIKR